MVARFVDRMWENGTYQYRNLPLEFAGLELGCTHLYGQLPSILGLFDKFWFGKMLRKIGWKFNRYAPEVVNEDTDGKFH